MTKNQTFSCIVNGLSIDSYQLLIKKLNNEVLYDSGNSTEILHSNGGITYNGIWNNNTNQRIDDMNSVITYYGYGWNTFTQHIGYYSDTVHHSATANDYMQMDFAGNGINCYFTYGKDKGIFEVYIDGLLKQTVDTYTSGGTGSSNNNFKVLGYSVTDLPLDTHTIKIVVTGNRNASSTLARVEFDYFQVLNDNGSKNSNVKGNSFSYDFNNTGVNLYMDKTPNSGIIDVQIDGVTKETIDLYSNSYNINTLVYSNLNLSNSSHTIKVIVKGEKNTQSKDCYCYFNRLQILSKTILPSKVYDKHTLNITIPANTITYKGQMKWQLICWNSDNDNESVSSGEFVFCNMKTPSIGINSSDVINNKQFEFKGSYSQAENISIKKWNMGLYSQNYIINEGYFGQNDGLINGEILNEGTFDDIDTATIRYYINEGQF